MSNAARMFKEKDIEYLELFAKGLSFLPVDCRIVSPNVKRIDLSENYLSSFPSDIKHLTKLEQFNLSSNVFTCIPYQLSISFASLQNLMVRILFFE